MIPFLAILVGLGLLVYGADKFVEGAAATAHHYKVPSLLIGMLILGFGTSAPELMVSALASWQGNPGVAVGNAFGSNVANIGLVLGSTALLAPVVAQTNVLRRELPLLALATAVVTWQVHDSVVTGLEGAVLLLLFAAFMGWSVYKGMRERNEELAKQVSEELKEHPMSLKAGLFWLAAGLIMMLAASRSLVWGAVVTAQHLGVSDLVVGLTVVAVGTSLPELASSLAAVRKKEHGLVLGNILGSNLFNTLAVVGLAGVIHPISMGPEVFRRDALVMGVLTALLFIFCFGLRTRQRIDRLEGGVLLAAWVAYTAYLVWTVLPS